jgi:hypothetical protein
MREKLEAREHDGRRRRATTGFATRRAQVARRNVSAEPRGARCRGRRPHLSRWRTSAASRNAHLSRWRTSAASRNAHLSRWWTSAASRNAHLSRCRTSVASRNERSSRRRPSTALRSKHLSRSRTSAASWSVHLSSRRTNFSLRSTCGVSRGAVCTAKWVLPVMEHRDSPRGHRRSEARWTRGGGPRDDRTRARPRAPSRRASSRYVPKRSSPLRELAHRRRTGCRWSFALGRLRNRTRLLAWQDVLELLLDAPSRPLPRLPELLVPQHCAVQRALPVGRTGGTSSASQATAARTQCRCVPRQGGPVAPDLS